MHLMQGQRKLNTIIGHSIVNSDYLIVVLRVRSLPVVRSPCRLMTALTQLLQPLSMFLLENGPFFHECRKFLSHAKLNSTKQEKKEHTRADAMLCFNRVSSVLIPICTSISLAFDRWVPSIQTSDCITPLAVWEDSYAKALG